MNKSKRYFYSITMTTMIAIITLFTYSIDAYKQNQNTSTIVEQDQNQINISLQNKFISKTLNEIPYVVINSTYGQYKFGADFSLDYGDETVIEQDINAMFVPNMQLDKDDINLYLELQCDGKYYCGTGLGPESISIYLIDNYIQDIQVTEKTFPVLKLESKGCGIQSIEDCANFDFSIPPNIILNNYKIEIMISFDEAKWIFINPIEIVN